MKKIYAPWRERYVTHDLKDGSREHTSDECVFCSQFAQNEDDKHLILKRFSNVAIVMNLYPYHTGHLMILPLAHIPDLVGLSAQVRAEFMEATNHSIEILKKVIKPHGFNVGMNLGEASGGGIPSHLHQHVLPRWNGDTNFMPLIAGTKVISTDIQETFKKLKKVF